MAKQIARNPYGPTAFRKGVFDDLGYLDRYLEENSEEFLDYCDWMGGPLQFCAL